MNLESFRLDLSGYTPLPYNMQGWFGEAPVFADLITLTLPNTIIEVGTWYGQSALHMADLAPQATIICVDTWLGAEEFYTTHAGTPDRDLMLRLGYPQAYYQFLSNVVHRKRADQILPIPLPSSIAAKVLAFRGVTADLIYIDGSHDPEDVRRDIAGYLPLLNPGGTIFGDDINWPGMRETLADLLPGYTQNGNHWICTQP